MTVGSGASELELVAVDATTWRDVARLEVHPHQSGFVAAPTYYLALCHYGDTWSPLAILAGGNVIGFMMWGVDPADESCWLGGIIVDKAHQGRGYGRAAVEKAVAVLHRLHGFTRFALSYRPENETAKAVYGRAGFEETGEVEDGEVVARMTVPS